MTADTLIDLRRTLAARRDAAIAQFRTDLRPDALLIELRRAVDATLRDLVRHHPLPAGATLAAVGGYGRGELYPYSDVDLLIILPRPAGAACEQAVASFVAALWDLGLEPGHSVRTVAECETEAEADITVETALLESRWLAGSRSLMRTFEAAMRARMDPALFFEAKLVEMQQRHARHHDTPYSLEPNCKESPGGLRDLQVIMWMARATGLGQSWREIAQQGVLTGQEARDLRRAEQAFKRLRIELHLLARRREDRVLFDLQPGLAQAYGLVATATRRASEIMMQRYYWAARLVNQLNTILVQNMEERVFPRPPGPMKALDDEFCNVNDKLDIQRDDAFERNPTLLLRAFLVMQQHPELRGMTARTQRAIWHARDRIDGQFRRNPVNRRLFLQILQQPRGIVHELRRMNMLNVLPRYLPVFRRIVGQMQHDLFHVYPVDQHTLAVIRNLRRFAMPEHAQEYPLASQLMADFDRHWLLYVAGLFHDIAKGRGGDHSELGARDVRRFAAEHALEHEDAELVEFLVRQHLAMSTVAQKKDLSNPEVISSFATLVGSERRLTALYLLTVADIRGTSPKVWNAWKGKLLEDLYKLTLSALGGQRPDTGTVLNERKNDAIRLTRLAGLRDESREAFWRQLDVAYFLRHDSTDIAWHTRHLYYQPNPAAAVVRARTTDQGEGLQIMVYTRDVPDLFMTICGFFDARSFSVQDARIHTTRHGYALDSFIVLPPEGVTELRAQASLIEHELSDRLKPADDQTATAGHETEHFRRSRQSRRSKLFPVRPQITLQPDEDGRSWRLSIVATDRSGLLHAMARVMRDHRVNVRMAKIMTLGDRVEDVFIIEGETLQRPRTQMQFERDILDTLAADTRAAAYT